MRRSSWRHLGMFVGGFTFVVVCVGVVLNEVKRHQLIKKHEHLVAVAQQDLAHLMNTSVSSKPEEVVHHQQQALAAEQEVVEIKNRWNVLNVASENEHQEKVKRLIQINKDLIRTYEEELAQLVHVGEHEQSERVLFVREKIVQARMNIVTLQKKLLMSGDDKNGFVREKMQQLLVVHQESIKAYEEEIGEYLKLGVAQNDPKIHFAREQIAEKRQEIAQLEKGL